MAIKTGSTTYIIKYTFCTPREGDLRVVRPFVYVREKDLRQFATEVGPIDVKLQY